jgi:anti-sigma factor RsiW
VSEPLDQRVAELLSADLDGAVSPEEHELARQWVERSPAARAEQASLAAVRAAVAGLPLVDPPAGFFEAMLERGAPRPEGAPVPLRRRPILAAGAAVAAAAAGWVVVAGGGAAAVTPPVEDVEAALLDEGGPFALRQQTGEVAWSELPDGRRGRDDGAATWVDLTAPRGMARIVVARDDVVLTLVSADLDADALVEVGIGELDDRGPAGDGILDRLRRACGRLLGAN